MRACRTCVERLALGRRARRPMGCLGGLTSKSLWYRGAFRGETELAGEFVAALVDSASPLRETGAASYFLGIPYAFDCNR